MGAFAAVDLIQPLLAMAAGVALMWFPGRWGRAIERRHAARLAELEAGAEEAFFEERRALEAYRPPKSDMAPWRLLGALLFLLGAFLVFGPR
jgi:uncharacterized membrane protein